ncbi:MAG TPA: NAD(P)-dependent oxidoreductase, partial [Acidimicrobiales bacterium]|nr:NAD(P)-dependent oxidoreductase [Acidimicrobiales bacterium]
LIEPTGLTVTEEPAAADALVWLDPHDVEGLAAALAAGPGIRWVQLPSAGVDRLIESGIIASGIITGGGRGGRTWTAAKGVYAEPVAEHALALLLAGLRDLDDRARATTWGDRTGRTLFGARVAILGAGGIAQALLRLLEPFRVDATLVRRQAEPGAGGAGTGGGGVDGGGRVDDDGRRGVDGSDAGSGDRLGGQDGLKGSAGAVGAEGRAVDIGAVGPGARAVDGSDMAVGAGASVHVDALGAGAGAVGMGTAGVGTAAVDPVGMEPGRMDAGGLGAAAVPVGVAHGGDGSSGGDGLGLGMGPGVSRVVGLADLHAVLAEADAVVLALALTPETIGVIAEPELRAMRDDAWLVNVARGPHIVTDDLVRALHKGWIGGAALDVTDPEPLPDGHPLWAAPNCLITPHSACPEALAGPHLTARIAENARRFAAGQELLGPVDTEHGY